jgi:hypothetical protein
LRHFAECPQFADRAAKLIGALAQFAEQPRILDSDDGLGGEARSCWPGRKSVPLRRSRSRWLRSGVRTFMAVPMLKENEPIGAGLIDYNGHIEVHSSLLNVVLHDQPQIRR